RLIDAAGDDQSVEPANRRGGQHGREPWRCPLAERLASQDFRGVVDAETVQAALGARCYVAARVDKQENPLQEGKDGDGGDDVEQKIVVHDQPLKEPTIWREELFAEMKSLGCEIIGEFRTDAVGFIVPVNNTLLVG